MFPNILPAPVPSVTLFNLTTMQRDLQNAYSRQASLEVERQLGRLGTVERRATQYLRGPEPADGDQPERAVVRGGRHQQRLPADSRLRQQQPVLVGGRVHLPRAARVVHAAAVALGLLPRELHAVEGR